MPSLVVVVVGAPVVWSEFGQRATLAPSWLVTPIGRVRLTAWRLGVLLDPGGRGVRGEDEWAFVWRLWWGWVCCPSSSSGRLRWAGGSGPLVELCVCVVAHQQWL